RADIGGACLAILEQHQGGNAANAVLGRGILVFVDVELGDRQAAGVFGGDFFQDGGDHFARATPGGPVIDQHRLAGLDHIGLEACVADVLDLLAHGDSRFSSMGRAGDSAVFGLFWMDKNKDSSIPLLITTDRKSTRLNSSHVKSSYAV